MFPFNYSVIQSLISHIGKAVSWLNLVLIALVVMDLLLRNLFGITANWVGEAQWHLFSLMFLLGAAYTLQKDRHVRVDLFYERFSPNDRRLTNLIGTLVLLLPWAMLLLVTGSRYAWQAWVEGEGSPNPGGIPYYWVIKAAIPAGAALLMVQGVLTLVELLREKEEVTAD
ncbi:MAG: TRAP transporter small permease subunit [Saprospiraceae bacterium]